MLKYHKIGDNNFVQVCDKANYYYILMEYSE